MMCWQTLIMNSAYWIIFGTCKKKNWKFKINFFMSQLVASRYSFDSDRKKTQWIHAHTHSQKFVSTTTTTNIQLDPKSEWEIRWKTPKPSIKCCRFFLFFFITRKKISFFSVKLWTTMKNNHNWTHTYKRRRHLIWWLGIYRLSTDILSLEFWWCVMMMLIAAASSSSSSSFSI